MFYCNELITIIYLFIHIFFENIKAYNTFQIQICHDKKMKYFDEVTKSYYVFKY